ncbi:hypothetical protein BK126_26180 [Paenibacillus sp. FSL H7-0326]|uniref:hypothetical protein n=1 Tax=Paenibacillus sp. FSL H7-0326 TaxID=1921144 RepID=UPI00096E47C9|nr:hypothetical protein [Paenibacillus sp. FSL H7-0326]OMC63685.1 hypothetical protein BK126_26180 [Paenibacillus sp. FSL H7-0326]
MFSKEDVRKLLNSELDAKVAELLGWKVQFFGELRGFSGQYQNEKGVWIYSHIYPYSSEHEYSMNVQARALKTDSQGYIRTLAELLNVSEWGTEGKLKSEGILKFLEVTPRERCEAAYLVLQK